MKNLLLAVVLSFSVLAPTAFAAKLTVKIGTVAPANTPWADSLEDIRKRVEKESSGDIQVKAYLGGQLGGEIEILRGIRSGRIQGGGITSAALATAVPELDIVEIPFLFDSSEEADFVLDQFLLEPFRKLFEKKGLVLVSWAENGWRDIGLKSKVVHTPEDLKGVKLRSQESKTHLMFWKKLGANPVAIAIPEVLPALQTGIVDGFDNTPLFTLSAEWHTAIKHYTVSNHIYQPAAVVYSKSFWDKLDAKQQKILMGEGNAMAAPARKGVRALGDQLLDILKDAKIEVYRMTPAERAKFRETVKDLPQEIVNTTGGDSERIFQLIQDGKKAFASKKKSGK